MGINRQKKTKKSLEFYCNNFGFRKPYQFLIDGTFCHVALKNQINIRDQLTKYFENVKLLTTQCAILETERLGSHVYGAMLIVKQFIVHACGHDKKPIAATSCFKSMVKKSNPNRYIVATQDRDLQKHCERVPGTPVIFIHQKAPTLMKPSSLSLEVAQSNCSMAFNVSKDTANLRDLKKEILGPQEQARRPFRKPKKKGGPNPLSCKKKKTKPQQKEPKPKSS